MRGNREAVSALVLTELRSFRTEVERRFERMDERFEHVDERIERSEREMQEFRAEVAAGLTRWPAGLTRSNGPSIDWDRVGGSAMRASFDRPWRRCWSSPSESLSSNAPSPASSSMS